ncbi:type IV secretory system conjugative DNA transfer family protein [Acinetobacter pittii]|uniref:Type IV secretory system conjugative DNA transfer family protein n=1 Tax=Acinetobacter pittii TaxID=48296 RepID=A0A6H0G0C1_ACIPI|nr:type IV secretory system conjugative DNA transfer family protein [Acinetobacter pittii]QIT19992.1 type IV secretory system conjugative DNA transfer family protein [Acinetobacter pittii]
MNDGLSFKSMLPIFIVGIIVTLVAGHYGTVYFFMDKLNVGYSFSFKDFGLLYDLQQRYSLMANGDNFSDAKNVADKIKLYIMAGYLPAIVWIGMFVMLFWDTGRKLHGDARFATQAEIQKAGYFPVSTGKNKPKYPPILFGKYGDKLLKYCSNEFYSVAAPTRSGKGVSIVIPNLLNYPESAVVFDVKSENFDITAGFRSKYTNVYRFSPTALDYCSHGYNPMDYVRRDPLHVVSDIQNIAKILYPTSNPNMDVFFNQQAQTLFLGLSLYMIEKEQPLNLADLLKLSTPKNGMNLQEWIVAEMETEAVNLTIDCVDALLSFANTSDKTASSILASFQAPLNIFRDPVIAAATSKSDFNLEDIRRKKMSIYVCINVGDVEKCAALMNLFFSQLIDLNTKVLPEQDPTLKYQCLLLMDEFLSLGYMGVIEKGVSFIAGYGLRLLVIFQNREQGNIAYPKGFGTILSNINGKAVFAPNELVDARDYSEMLGYETVKGKSRSNQSKGGSSTTISDQKRALMLPQELRELDPDTQIIIFRGQKPILCKKIKYFEDEVFIQRANLPKPKVPPLDLRSIQSKNKEARKESLYTTSEIPVEKLATIPHEKRINNDEILNMLYMAGGVVDADNLVI